MHSELARVKTKIKALAAKTVEAGCSEHEALHAAEMVGRLLDQYNLSMDEIDIREEVCVLSEVPVRSKRRMRNVISRARVSLMPTAFNGACCSRACCPGTPGLTRYRRDPRRIHGRGQPSGRCDGANGPV
jgi:hypothetical protein